MVRAPRDIGDKLIISALNDSGPISYPLARVPNNVSYETVSEQPEAEPNQPVAWPLTFHGGISYSEYDPRVGGALTNAGLLANEPNIIKWPPKLNGVSLADDAKPPNYFFEATVNDSGADDGQPVLYVIVNEAAEINVYKISLDSGDFGTLLNTKTFAITPTQPCGHPAEWNDGSNTRWYLGLGDNGKIQRLDSVVSSTSADTWAASSDADARHLKVVGNQLVRSTNENQVSILPRAGDPNTEASWGGDFFVGEVSSDITELGEASGLGYIATELGFFEWDLTGEAENVFPEIGKAERNGQGMVYWHGGFLIPAATGLWWTRTGTPVGPDSNPNNFANSPSLGTDLYAKHGRWTGLAPFGKYIYALYSDSTGQANLVLQGRERDDEDPPGWGPLVWHVIGVVGSDLADFQGIHIAKASEFGATDVRPSLWAARGDNLAYWWLDKDGDLGSRRGDIEVGPGNVPIRSGNFHFGYPRVLKQLQVIEGWGEDLSATEKFDFRVYRDGGSAEAVGAEITSDGFFQRFWTQDTNDTARSMLVECRYTGDSSTGLDGPRLFNVMVRAILVPGATREWTFLLAVEDEQSKTAKKIRSELEGYVGDMKKYTLPDKDTFNGVMGKVRMLRADEISALTPRNLDPPHYVIAAPVREISGS